MFKPLIDPQIAADEVRKIAAEYDIRTDMTFGGEPLLYTDAVYAFMKTAKDLNIPMGEGNIIFPKEMR